MKGFKQPDVKAPRYRPSVVNLLNEEFYKKFIHKYPEHSDKGIKQFRELINTFHTELWKTVIEHRDGVDLPEGIGNIFIGTCWKPKRKNINFKKSITYDQTVTNQNYETDGKLGKIFYTNYKNKYRFRNRAMWLFTGHRDFKRTVAAVYPNEWKKYIAVDPNLRINKLYKRHLRTDYAKAKTEELLVDYNEFDID